MIEGSQIDWGGHANSYAFGLKSLFHLDW
ncbi:hypothetical protein [Algoriphagus boritolerans]